MKKKPKTEFQKYKSIMNKLNYKLEKKNEADKRRIR